MPYLTKEEVQTLHPLGGTPLSLAVYHDIQWWNQIVLPGFPNPIKLKFNDRIRNRMPANIRNGKGIYIFCIEPKHPFTPKIKHILYVGRVRAGRTGYNFFRRFNYYVNAIGNKKSKRNIMRLTNLWPDFTYVYYFDLTNLTDSRIAQIERLLYSKIVPPLNEFLEGEARATRQFC